MVLPHNLKCPVSITKPRPVGVCDRSGFLYYLDEMVWQFQWNSTTLVNQRILVGPDQLDKPAEFLRTPRFGPEPAPLVNARPTHYATQNLGPNTVSQILDDENITTEGGFTLLTEDGQAIITESGQNIGTDGGENVTTEDGQNIVTEG